jgi:hypothetical protein
MTLTPNQRYKITELEHVFYLTLLKVPGRNVTHYMWRHDDGRICENRQQDVDRWVKFGEINKVEL